MNVATLLVLAAALAATSPLETSAPTPHAAKKGRRAHRARASIPVEGMSCGRCAANITAALEATDGVERAAVDLERGRVEVTFVPKKVSIDRIVDTIRKLGYRPGTPEVDRG